MLRAQARFPERALTLVRPFAPGGVADISARAVGEQMAVTLGHPVVVDNKPSAGSTLHLSARLFGTAAGFDMLVVPNKGTPAVLTALRAGEVEVDLEIAGPLVPQVRAGAVREARPRAQGSTPAELQALLGSEIQRWSAVIRRAKIEPE